MSNSKKSNAGRKQQHHETADGTQIKGLSRMTDGRWRIIGTQIRFSEPDEAKAVEKFYKLTRQQSGAAELSARQTRNRAHNFIGIDWAAVAKELVNRPAWVAEQCKQPLLAYWKQNSPPENIPTVAQVKTNWQAHATCGDEQKSKVATYWDAFVEFTKIKTIDEITPQIALDYQDFIYTEGYAAKTQQHFFNGIRGILRVKRTQVMAMDAVNKAISNLKLMSPNDVANNPDPKPISIANWKALLAVVTGDDKAMLLCMLNCCLYLGEVVTMQWDEIKDDGTYVSRRQKRGQNIRVATLWPETIEALAAMERKGPEVFRSNQGTQLSKFTAFERFREWRRKAKENGAAVDDVTPSHLRDGAYSAAVAANITLPLCQLLAGHATGMSDNYVLGSPEAVAPACKAVRAKYMT